MVLILGTQLQSRHRLLGNPEMIQQRTLLIALGAVFIVSLPLALCRPFAYRVIEFTDPALTARSLTHRPAPGVLMWNSVPRIYELHTSLYVIHLFRGTERYPRIFIDAVGTNGASLRIRGIGIRGTRAPFFYDWVVGDSNALDITVVDTAGRPIGRHKLIFRVPVRGMFVEFDGL